MRLLAQAGCFVFIATVLMMVNGCRETPPPQTVEIEPRSGARFDIYWPPRNLDRAARLKKTKPLLNGSLDFHWDHKQKHQFSIAIQLSRPEDEESRERWNRTLAFPEYSWMSRVRVWDADKKWLWPNLPYLLTAHGEKRVERYGGIDPSKGVDNDFAAVLIRPLDSDGSFSKNVEPLVSAQWNPLSSLEATDKNSLVKTAISDTFVVDLNQLGSKQGKIGVWLIYADFLGSSPPYPWPQEKEFAGGILAYFEISWKFNADQTLAVSTNQMNPKKSTGFDWETWSTGKDALKKNLSFELNAAANNTK